MDNFSRDLVAVIAKCSHLACKHVSMATNMKTAIVGIKRLKLNSDKINFLIVAYSETNSIVCSMLILNL